MNKLIIIFLIFGLFQITDAFSQETNENDSKLKSEQFHPIYLQFGLDTLKTKSGEIRKIDSTSIAPFTVTYFVFRERNQDSSWPYGFGYLISDGSSSNENVIWYNLIYGDFDPHSFSWVDFDNDGDKDLFHLYGYEDVFWE